MLFSSHAFVLFFLPAIIGGFYLFYARGASASSLVTILLFGSSLFYLMGVGSQVYVVVVSIAVNYLVGAVVARSLRAKTKKTWLILGVSFNVGMLAIYKYLGFFVRELQGLLPYELPEISIALPLAISFFTFQQIAYLVDVYRGGAIGDFRRYALFVLFFPQLIAGPIVHFRDVVRQFKWPNFREDKWRIDLGLGLSIFSLGLAKKVLIADEYSVYADTVFDSASAGMVPNLIESWVGVLAYTFQIYFDFSGYSDMATGLARLFGVTLTVNFFSPYRSRNISEFWRRWNITLSSFLRDYLYIPLGGNRRGPTRTLFNLVITMLIAGIWHGAGWNFLIWGAGHGFLLLVHRSAEPLFRATNEISGRSSAVFQAAAWLATFASVALLWVVFRSPDMATAMRMYQGLIGCGGAIVPSYYLDVLRIPHGIVAAVGFQVTEFALPGFRGIETIVLFIVTGTIVMFFPNTYEFTKAYRPVEDFPSWPQPAIRFLNWAPSLFWAAVLSALLAFTIYNLGHPQEFIYFEF